MYYEFNKALKEKSYLRAAIYGPAGSGKTYSSLAIASGFSKKIALVDTERGRARKYAGAFKFDALELIEKSTENYVRAIEVASDLKYEVLIVDSLTHAWKELLQEVDFLAEHKYHGNSQRAWGEANPKQNKLLEAIFDFPGHVIATMRTKTEWVIEKDQATGKVTPMRIGLAPEQARGIEYEFDLVLELDAAHVGRVIKDSTGGDFQDRLIEKPGKAFGRELADLFNQGIKAKSANRQPISRRKTSDAEQAFKEVSEKLNACTTKEEVHKIAQQYASVIEGLPAARRREVVELGKSLRQSLPEGKGKPEAA